MKLLMFFVVAWALRDKHWYFFRSEGQIRYYAFLFQIAIESKTNTTTETYEHYSRNESIIAYKSCNYTEKDNHEIYVMCNQIMKFKYVGLRAAFIIFVGSLLLVVHLFQIGLILRSKKRERKKIIKHTLNFQRYIFFLIQGGLIYWILGTGSLWNHRVTGFKLRLIGYAPWILQMILLSYLLIMRRFR